VAIPALGSFCERVEYSLTYISFASFNVPYNPVCFMYEKKQLAFNFWCCALCSRKYGTATNNHHIKQIIHKPQGLLVNTSSATRRVARNFIRAGKKTSFNI